ncbi:MAG: type II toxin-antitoxin system Phd/YefM family antitoxin [Myxococcaceae bacterium]
MKLVNVAALKANLSRYLRAVRRGQQLVVTDHKLPVAKVVPYEEPGPAKLEIRRAKDPAALGRLRFPPVKGGSFDSLEALLEDRRSER